jgi:multiple sugar transport system permease protein
VTATSLSPREVAPALGSRKKPIRPLRLVTKVLWWIAVVAIAFSTVMPLLWTMATSLKPPAEVIGGYLSILPRHPTLDNYRRVFTETPFARYLVNSAVLAVAGTATNLFFGGLGGYALAKLRFRGRTPVFAMFLGSMMVPGIVTMVPTFLVLRYFPLVGGNDLTGQGGFGFINTYWAIVLPGAAGPLAVFFMRQFFLSLPDELGEAARIDGASEFKIFSRVYLPLAKGGLAVLGVMTLQAGWNAFLWPLIVLNDPRMFTVQVALSSFVNDKATDFGPLMAGTVLTSLPMLALFLFTQRWIIEGIAHIGSK